MYSCKICLDDEEFISALPCGHIFGTTCAEIHLRLTPSCPTCRQPCELGELLRLHADFWPVDQADVVDPRVLASSDSPANEMEEEPQLLVEGMPILGAYPFFQGSELSVLSSPSNDSNEYGEEDERVLFSREERDSPVDVFLGRRTASLHLPAPDPVPHQVSTGGSSDGSCDDVLSTSESTSTSDSSDLGRLEEVVKTHVGVLSHAVKNSCKRLKYAMLINATMEETMHHITLAAEKEAQIEDLLEELVTVRQARGKARKNLARLRKRDKEARRRYEVGKEEFYRRTRHFVITNEVNEVQILQLRDANARERSRSLKYREKLMNLRDRHMDQGAGVLDLEDLDDDDDVQSEVSLQMPGSYPRTAWNDADRYSPGEPPTHIMTQWQNPRPDQMTDE